MEEHDADRSQLGKWEYANYFEVGHNAFEFLVDCGQEGRPDEQLKVYLRIITSPVGAQRLFQVLGNALLRYADSFGPIPGDAPAGEVKPGR
jgi:hypothetical protein